MAIVKTIFKVEYKYGKCLENKVSIDYDTYEEAEKALYDMEKMCKMADLKFIVLSFQKIETKIEDLMSGNY